MKCFYCRQTIVAHPFVKGTPQRWNHHTKDHVIPKSLTRKLGIGSKLKARNIVDCCARCNVFKANKNPLDMFVYLTDETAKMLRNKLVEIGVPGDIVDEAYFASRQIGG